MLIPSSEDQCGQRVIKTICDEDITFVDMPMKVKNKVSSFLCLHNDIISKNLLLLNIGMSNVIKNNSDGDGAWIC